MIRWAKLGPGADRYYLEPVAEAVEPPGVWSGRGAARLGLVGEVGGDELRAVLAGRHPHDDTVGRLTSRPTRVPGWDLTFAVPKSVSVLWALAGGQVASEVEAAQRRAAAATLSYLERRAVRDDAGPSEMVAAAFAHHVSRSADPHLHVHAVVANLNGRADRWRALESVPLVAHLSAAGHLFEAHLRHELSERLAVEWGPVVNGVAQLKGVDPHVRRAFSSRRAQVESGMAAHGGSSPLSARIAALDGRPDKRHVPLDERRQGWWDRAEAVGVTNDVVAAVIGRAGGETKEVDADRVMTGVAASSFSRRDVLVAVGGAATRGLPVDEAERWADAILASDRVVRLSGGAALRAGDVIRTGGGRIVPTRTDVARWSTPEEVTAQRRLADAAARLAGAGSGLAAGDSDRLTARGLAPREAVALHRLITSGDGVELVSAPPGPGRWAVLEAARRAWQSSGLDVAGLAPDVRSAREMEAATGIATMVGERPCHPASAVVVVSGGEQLSCAAAEGLAELAARGAKVVLVGDPGAIARADRAGAWRAIESSVGASRVPRRSSAELINDRPGVAAGPPAEQPRPPVVRVSSRLTLAAGQDELRRCLVADWEDAVGEGRRVVMVAPRRADVDDLNARAAASLHDRGRLSGPPLGADGLRQGETVLVARTVRGSPVRAGELWDIEATGAAVRLRSPSGPAVELPPELVARLDLRRGYAMTPYQARLLSPAEALVIGDPLVHEGGPRPTCPTSFYAVADLAPERWARSAPVPFPPAEEVFRAAPSPGPAEGARAVASLAAVAVRLEDLRCRLTPPADPSAALAAAMEERDVAARSVEEVPGPMWQRRLERATATIEELRAAEQGRRRWTADHAEELGEYAELSAAAALRRQALGRAAELSPGPHVIAALGPRPGDAGARAAWREAAGALEAYRERWGLTDDPRALGPPPTTPGQTADLGELRGLLRSLGRSRDGRDLRASAELPSLVAPLGLERV
ncbi:MAG TPA: MobF family relaxase [Acidimicrobiales bacterium]|nr:MobF family relaxase [Acidimicrobiales bacterium]